MNEVVNKYLLTGDKSMPELHLRQPRFTYRACGPFTKHRLRIQKFRETGNSKHIYKNELDKAYFAHDAAYSDSKDLAKKTISEKILKVRAYEIAINLNMVDIKEYWQVWSISFLIRKRMWSDSNKQSSPS